LLQLRTLADVESSMMREVLIVNEASNVDVIKRLYDAMGRGDMDAALALTSEDVTFVVPGPLGVGAAGTWHGHAGVRESFRKLREGQQNQSAAVVSIVAQGDQVVVLLHVKATALATGKTFESDIIHFFTIKEGKIVTLLDFFDTAALVEAYRP